MAALFPKDLVMNQGDFFTNELWMTYKDSTGALVDLTGYSAVMQIRSSTDSQTVVLELSDANGYILLGGSAGTIKFAVPDTVTSALNFYNCVYDLKLTPPNGETFRLVEGAITLSKEVTR